MQKDFPEKFTKRPIEELNKDRPEYAETSFEMDFLYRIFKNLRKDFEINKANQELNAKKK